MNYTQRKEAQLSSNLEQDSNSAEQGTSLPMAQNEGRHW